MLMRVENEGVSSGSDTPRDCDVLICRIIIQGYVLMMAHPGGISTNLTHPL